MGRSELAPGLRGRERGAGRSSARPPARHRHDAHALPSSPGEVLRDGVCADTGITITEFARRIGVTRAALWRVLDGKAAIGADMALRLSAALGGSAESWPHMHASYAPWQAERALKRTVAKIEPLRHAP